MPWQRRVADVALQVDPETGRLAFREVVLTVPRQSGKALDCNTEIFTARGWVRMRDIHVGDEVFHPDGHAVAVTFTSDVMHGHDCYRVTTTDGRSVVADGDHLWTVMDKRREQSIGPRGRRHRWFGTITLSTREMLEAGLSRYASGSRTSVTDGKRYATNEYRFVLPIQEPIKSPDVDLPLDPYLLGAWLGDGTSRGSSITVGPADRDWMMKQISEALARTYADPRLWESKQGGSGIVSATLQNGRAWFLRFRLDAQMRDGFESRCRRLGIWGNKHVPNLYLTAGTAQREALLQGLLDTDGSIDGVRGQVEFCSMLRPLADAVLFLARSLGWRATLRTGRAMLNGRDCGTKYRVCFTPKTTDPFRPFRLPRKAARIRDLDGNKGRATLSIAAIEPVTSVPVRCIKVDSPDGLFLAGRDLVPTHNTTLILAAAVQRALGFGGRQGIVYTAQTRLDARKKWEDEHLPILKASPFSASFRARKTTGNEAFVWKNGSTHGLVSATRKSGHGPTLDLAFLDEAFAHEDDRLEQAFRPAMITRPEPQLWVVSTAGTLESTYLRGKVAAGRSRIEAGIPTSSAYFEWSAPEDSDPLDPAGWYGCMPALGYTITEAAIRTELDAMVEEHGPDGLRLFRRAYLNQWVDEFAEQWTVIPKAVWSARSGAVGVPDTSVAFALAVAWPDAEFGSIAVAGRRGGELLVQVVDHRPGTSWMVDRAVELQGHGPCAFVVDPGGPAGRLIADLEAAGVELVKPSMREVAQAAGQFYSGVAGDEPYVRHYDQSELSGALAAVQKRPLGDAWTWARKGPVDVSPLEAVTLAAWGHATRGHLTGQPFFAAYR